MEDGMKEKNDQIGRVHVLGRRVWHFSDALVAFWRIWSNLKRLRDRNPVGGAYPVQPRISQSPRRQLPSRQIRQCRIVQ